MGFTSKLSSLASNQPAPPLPPAAFFLYYKKNEIKKKCADVRLNIWLSRTLFSDCRLCLKWSCCMYYELWLARRRWR